MQTINNGSREHLLIAGVHDGIAGVQKTIARDGAEFWTVVFLPNLATAKLRAGLVAHLADETLVVEKVEKSPLPGYAQALLGQVVAA